MLIKYLGGLGGVRDMPMLESALDTPFATYDGVSNFPTLEAKAARLAFGIIKNHPFVDGNKRIGVLVMKVFLEDNGEKMICSDQDLIRIGDGIADGTLNEKAIIELIINYTK